MSSHLTSIEFGKPGFLVNTLYLSQGIKNIAHILKFFGTRWLQTREKILAQKQGNGNPNYNIECVSSSCYISSSIKNYFCINFYLSGPVSQKFIEVTEQFSGKRRSSSTNQISEDRFSSKFFNSLTWYTPSIDHALQKAVREILTLQKSTIHTWT